MSTNATTHNSTKTKARTTTRSTELRKRLRRKSGATVAELQEVFGWQPHSVRAAISGLRRAGNTVERFQSSCGSAYRIVRSERVNHGGA